MGISLKHPEVLVFCDLSNFHHIKTLLKEPAGGFMSQIVEAEINETGSSNRTRPKTSKGSRRERKNPAIEGLRKLVKDLESI